MKAVTGKCKIWKSKQIKYPLLAISIVYFLRDLFFTEDISWTTTIQLGIVCGMAQWADSVSLWTNTIASCDQFKPIRVWENLVVNYNGFWYKSTAILSQMPFFLLAILLTIYMDIGEKCSSVHLLAKW